MDEQTSEVSKRRGGDSDTRLKAGPGRVGLDAARRSNANVWLTTVAGTARDGGLRMDIRRNISSQLLIVAFESRLQGPGTPQHCSIGSESGISIGRGKSVGDQLLLYGVLSVESQRFPPVGCSSWSFAVTCPPECLERLLPDSIRTTPNGLPSYTQASECTPAPQNTVIVS